MADLADVTAFLAAQCATAVYPNGTSQPSVAAMDCRIYEGWPLPDKLDKDMRALDDNSAPRAGGPVANVSVYPMLGTGTSTYQILDETYVLIPAAHGMVVTVVSGVINVSGQPVIGEYLTLVCDGNIVFSQTGASTTALLANLAAQALSHFPGTVSTATTLTVPVGHSLVVRQGSPATLGKAINRQRHMIMITVWAPNRRARTALSKAIDLLTKKNTKITMPDTSQALVFFSRTNVSDDQQAASLYRRDLVYEVTYATVETFPGYEVTSVDVTIASATGNAQAHALT